MSNSAGAVRECLCVRSIVISRPSSIIQKDVAGYNVLYVVTLCRCHYDSLVILKPLYTPPDCTVWFQEPSRALPAVSWNWFPDVAWNITQAVNELNHAHRPDAFSKSFRVSESPLTVASAVPVRLAAKR